MAGQTLSEIRGLLAAAGLAPRQRYGQNFLIDLNLMRKLVAAAEVKPHDVVLEVGCGTGSLTEMLLETGARVVGVEIDRGLQAILRERLGAHPRFTLIQGDALAGKHEINPLVLQVLAERRTETGAAGPHATAGTEPGRYKLVANLPYDIATPLLMELLYVTPRSERLTCTIQKEVAERLAAEAGTEAYGPVSVVTQTLADIRLIAIVPPTAFWPRPQVESVMLTLRPRPPEDVDVDDVPAFVRFVRGAFVHRRKMLRKAADHWGLSPADTMAAFGRAGISWEARPEAVTPAQWRTLHRDVASHWNR